MSSNLGLINPVNPGEITQAGMLLTVSNAFGTYYPTTTKPSTNALAAGFVQAGVIAELPTIEVGIETTPVTTGVYGLPSALLFKGVSGKISLHMYGSDAGLLALGLGVVPVTTSDTHTTTTSSAISVDSTTGNSKVTVTSATGFSVGMCIVVDTAANIASSCNIGIIGSITGSDVVFDRVLRDVSAISGSDFNQLKNIMLPIGGIAPKYRSLAALVDFPDGRLAACLFPQVYSAKPLSFGFGSGQEAVKVPIELQAIGVLDATYGVLVGKIVTWP